MLPSINYTMQDHGESLVWSNVYGWSTVQVTPSWSCIDQSPAIWQPMQIATVPYFGFTSPRQSFDPSQVMLQPRQAELSFDQTRFPIESVWLHNLEAVFSNITVVAQSHHYITFDCEFPAAIHEYSTYKPFFCRQPDEKYALLKANVDDLDVTQLGFTLSDGKGSNKTYEFNFVEIHKLNKRRQNHAYAALSRQGYDIRRDSPRPICRNRFADLLESSRIVRSYLPRTWLAFGSARDFAHLMKIMQYGRPLPATVDGFINLLKFYLGNHVYDCKYLMAHCCIYGGLSLEKVATTLDIKREDGEAHQAGSDALLTWRIFEKLKEKLLPGWEKEHALLLCGLQAI